MDTTRQLLTGTLLVLGVPVAVVIAIPLAILTAVIFHLHFAVKMGLTVIEGTTALFLRPVRERWLWGPARHRLASAARQ
jgi:hypothetical protein